MAPSRQPVFAPWLDLRAYKIDDALERLRFLRREMLALELEQPRPRRAPVRLLIWVTGTAALALLSGLKPARTTETPAREIRPAIRADVPRLASIAPSAKVWRVESSQTNETYSNGLRVDLTFATPNRPRAQYPVYAMNGDAKPVRYGTLPVGIVYHTTESHLAPFEEQENRRLNQLGRNLLDSIRRERSYHYLIDRFGRVFRVVPESDAANHSGYSVWADAAGIYVNLNASFLGVAFEGQTGASEDVTAAQISSARMLTEMLRSRYSIAAGDCVTHAQVSVNPQNMHIGAHTDWGAQFPFASLGLPDNYATPPASLYAFGFEYDGVFLNVIGEPWPGLERAQAQVERQAAAGNIPPARYRAMLQRRYKEIVAALKQAESEGGGS